MSRYSEIKVIEDWYAQWASSVYNVCYRITGNTQDAEDIMQECFIEAMGKKHQLNDINRQKAWLLSIARNKAINFLNRNHLRYTVDLPAELTGLNEEDLELDWSELSKEQILLSIDQLPQGYRTICMLYLFENMNHEQIANTLNISPSTSRSQYSRAKKILQSELLKQVQNG